MATPRRVGELCAGLTAMYPKDVAFLTQEQINLRTQIYIDLLRDISDDVLTLAVNQYIAGGGVSYPTVKQLRDMALSLAQAADDAPDAASAWRMACNAVEPWLGGGTYKVGALGALHPRVAKAIELYGLHRIALREDANAGTDFAQWRGLYESLAHRADEQARWLPQVRERIALMRAEMEAAKPAQIEAPAQPEPRASSSTPAGAPMRIGDVLKANGAGAPQLTKDQLDRRAHAARLIARRDALRESLAGETDEAKRKALEVQIDGITRTVAQYEVSA